MLNTAVTNALACSRPRLPAGPVPLTTAPVPSAKSALVTNGIS
jgi:hypothetical protein